MNEILHTFVAGTQAEFDGKMKTPRDLIQREAPLDHFVDTAVLAGYSISDIIHGKVTETDIDPEVIRAFHLQYPHVGDLISFIRSHSHDDAELSGIVSGIKGKLFELEYVDWLNHGHLPIGATAELAASPTQEGWDIAVRDSDGNVIEHLQLKATESLNYIKEAYSAHPEIDIVATREVFEHLDGSGLEDHVAVSDFSNGNLTEHVQGQIEAADITPEFGLPLVASELSRCGARTIQKRSIYRRWRRFEEGSSAAGELSSVGERLTPRF